MTHNEDPDSATNLNGNVDSQVEGWHQNQLAVKAHSRRKMMTRRKRRMTEEDDNNEEDDNDD